MNVLTEIANGHHSNQGRIIQTPFKVSLPLMVSALLQGVDSAHSLIAHAPVNDHRHNRNPDSTIDKGLGGRTGNEKLGPTSHQIVHLVDSCKTQRSHALICSKPFPPLLVQDLNLQIRP
jgi:hypothetical protein